MNPNLDRGPQRRRRPPGYTLIEMIAVMVLIATLIGVGSIVLQRLIRAEKAGRAALIDANAVSQLVDRFRQDAHAAVRMRTEPPDAGPPAALIFEHDGGEQVEYRVRDAELLVSRHAASSEALPNEVAYRFARRGSPRLEIIEAPGGSLAVLTFSDPGSGSIRDIHAEARVGRDLRNGGEGGGP